MASQNKLDKAYMKCAYAIAELSSAKRKQVGAILVKEGIIGEGYNGTPSGFDNCCEREAYMIGKNEFIEKVLVTLPEVLHAESNAIAKLARSTSSSEGSTLYVTTSPCFECAKLIIQSKIIRVVYAEQYRLTDGIDLLKKAGIQVDG